MTEIDHDCTDEIVCPYCGYEHEDSWEIADGDEDGVYECGECEKHFRYSAEHTVTYSTEKAPCLNNEGDHKWRTRHSIVITRYCQFCGKEESLPEGEQK